MYVNPLYRPPSEAYSAIIQATIGCSHNQCAFCNMYVSKKFSVLKEKELLNHIKSVASYYPHASKVFVADGNALVMPFKTWVFLLDEIHNFFPHVKQISTYATPKDILRKSEEELRILHKQGLSLLYMGIESGNDAILEKITKGANSSEIIAAGKKGIGAGFKISVTIIAGLGGDNPFTHARDTAHVISAIKPHYIGMLSLMLEPGARLYNEMQKGSFQPPLPLDYLHEAKIFLEHVDTEGSIFRSNHASNYLSLAGTLNQDRLRLINQIESVLSKPELLKPEVYRRL